MVADVPTIIRALASLTCPPWVIHQECWLQKEEGSCDVPHGKIDVVIGKPSPSGDLKALPGAGVAIALMEKDKKNPAPFQTLVLLHGVKGLLETPKSERQVILELLAFATTGICRSDQGRWTCDND